MTGTEASGSRLVAAFYPYGSGGSGGAPVPEPAGECLELGAAAIVDCHRGDGLERYRLSRAGAHWLLHSQAFSDPPRLLACVEAGPRPGDATEVAVELLLELWSLRLARRLRFAGPRAWGALGRAGWQRVAARLRPPPLEDRLKAEGHTVRAVPGPMGTREHLLVFPNRGHSHLLPLGRQPPTVDTSPATSRE